MKTVASLKSNTTNSPKTPGGISKSLLTPCRRLGLSRNWKRSGPSPFISPLASNADGSQSHLETETTTRKTTDINKKYENPASPNIDLPTSETSVDTTPSRHIALPRKRKSKIHITSINKEENIKESPNEGLAAENDKVAENSNSEDIYQVSTPVRQKSKSKIKKNLSQVKSTSQNSEAIKNVSDENMCDLEHKECKENVNATVTYSIKEKSPNELKKECVVVIQRKIFKEESENCQKTSHILTTSKVKQGDVLSQTLFDSDSDNLPLYQLNQKGSQKLDTVPDQDGDFVEQKNKIRKLNTNNKEKQKPDKKTEKIKKGHDNTRTKERKLGDSFDDDEDFDFDNKKTILIRKTYEKTAKPLKAKSTGSITQRDIDELKARIEVKKKLLLAKTLTEDTKELRDLIKKWKKGCQDALMELMDLMKRKFPEKSNMDYSEILQSLHIPASLVGYDSENDCFCTPDDASIVLAQINNL